MSDALTDALTQFALITLEREALRQRLAVLDRQWMELAQSEQVRSLLASASQPVGGAACSDQDDPGTGIRSAEGG